MLQGKVIQTADYVVFCVGLCISLATGIISAYRDRNHTSPLYFHRGGGKLKALPVAMSMLVTYESSIFFLGFPAEVYVHGFMFFVHNIGLGIGFLSVFMIAIPLFYPLKITSVYEYLQMRHDSPLIRQLTMGLNTISMLLYSGVVLFGAAVAVESVTGISVWISIVSMSVIAVIYTSLGGLKAVVMTDVVQGAIMIVMLLVVVIYGTLRAGGVQSVLDINNQSGRLNMLDFDPNPLIRHSFWTLVVGGLNRGFGFAYRQAVVQRFNSTRSITEAKKVAVLSMVGFLVLDTLAMVEGLVVYAYFANKGCDPLASGQIKNPNQIISFAVLDMFENIPGLTGLFLAALCSATLSTISSMLNCVSAIVSEDCIRTRWKTLSDIRLTNASKLIVVVSGVVCICMGLLISQMRRGPVNQIYNVVGTAVDSPVMTIFILSFFVRYTTRKGLILSVAVGMIFGVWLSLGNTFSKGTLQTPWLPLGPTDRCRVIQAGTYIVPNKSLTGHITDSIGTDVFLSATIVTPRHFTIDNNLNTTGGMNRDQEESLDDSSPLRGLDYLYSMSYWYFSIVTSIVALLSGIIVSKLTKTESQTAVPDNLMFSLNKQFFMCRPKYEAVSNGPDIEMDTHSNANENENAYEST